MKPRTCPHCSIRIPLDSGFSFDVKLNLICEKCKKVIVPVDEKSFVDVTPPHRTFPVHGAWNDALPSGNINNLSMARNMHPDA